MADRTIKAVLIATATQFIAELDKSKKKAEELTESLTEIEKARKVISQSEAGKPLSELDQAKKTVDEFEKKTAKAKESLNKLGTGALVAGGLLVAGVGGAIKAYSDFDKQMSEVAATGDDARQNMDALRDAAIKMGASTQFSATEAGQGIEELAKAGVSAKDTLNGGLKGALDLAAAGALSVGDAAETAASAMTQFGLSGEEIPHIADLLAAGAGKAQGSVDDLGQALNQSGLVAASFGLSIEDTTGTLSAFASAGLTGSDAGTSFKTMLQALANPSKKTAAAMADLGINAYDAQGSFIGITGLAQNLKDTLGPLTEETRNQALAQIFGSDAVRAANVLYEQGGVGIGEWIKKTNDAGYASETAATKMDNFKGDIEGLGGAFETAMIGLGEGADGPLRKVTQGLAGLLDGFNGLPSSVKQGTLAVAGVAGVALLATGGIIKLYGAVSETASTFRDLQQSYPGAVSGLGKVAKAAGAVAVAFAAAQASGAIIDKTFRDGSPGLADAGTALVSISKGAEDAANGMDQFLSIADTATGDIAPIQANVDGLGDALGRLLDKSKGQQFNDMVSGWLPGKDVAEILTERFGQLDQSIVSLYSDGKADQAAAAFGKIAEAAKAQGVAVEDVTALFPEYKAQLQQQANELEVTTLSAQDYADWMGGKIPAAITKAEEAQKSANTTMETSGDLNAALAAQEKLHGDALGKLNEATKKVIDSFTIFNGGLLDQETTNNNYLDSLAALSKGIEGNSTSLKNNTEDGRENRRSVIAAMEALSEKVKADFTATEATDGFDKATQQASKSLKQGEKDLRASALAAEYSKQEVDKMIDTFLMTPDELSTDVHTVGVDQALSDIGKTDKAIKGIENRKVAIDIGVNVNQTVLAKSIISKYGNGAKIPGLASGGPIQNWSGAAVKGQDTELIGAAYGEHMLPADEVDALGGHEGVYRMRQAIKGGRLRGFDRGGAVEREVEIKHGSVRPIYSAAEWNNISRAVAGVTAGATQSFGDAMAKQVSKNIDAELGTVTGNFGKIDINNPGGRTTFRGKTFSNLFAAGLRKAEIAAGATMSIFQGGFRPATSYSGTSHAGDAVDIGVSGALIRALRNVGIPTWDRTGKGNWAPHAHGVPLPGAGYAAGSAVWQAQDYLRGGDGLGGRDNGPRPSKPNNVSSTRTGSGGSGGRKMASAYGFGGSIQGISAHNTADDIGVQTTAREFVQPVAAVDYYGADVMEAVRARRIPRDSMRAFVGVSSSAPVFAQSTAAGGGQAGGGTATATLDPDSIRQAVRQGAREGIEAHIKTLDPRQAYGLIQSADRFGKNRGGQ